MTGVWRQLFSCAAAVGALFFAATLRADIVILRSGTRYADVKAQPIGESHRILFPDGGVFVISNSAIRSLKRAPTSWITVQPPAPQRTIPIRVEPIAPPARPREPAQALSPALKSMILPGWGQHSEGRPLAGLVYSSLSLITFQRYWTYRQQHAAAENDYNDPLPVGIVAAQTATGTLSLAQAALVNAAYLGQKERKVYRIQQQGNNALLVLSAIWFWNILDIGRGGVPWEKRWTGAHRSRGVPEFGFTFRRDSLGIAARFTL